MGFLGIKRLLRRKINIKLKFQPNTRHQCAEITTVTPLFDINIKYLGTDELIGRGLAQIRCGQGGGRRVRAESWGSNTRE